MQVIQLSTNHKLSDNVFNGLGNKARKSFFNGLGNKARKSRKSQLLLSTIMDKIFETTFDIMRNSAIRESLIQGERLDTEI